MGGYILAKDKNIYKEIILVNGEPHYGVFSVEMRQNDDGSIVTEGILKMHEYVEEIVQIESIRYLIKDVEVYSESFGSSDDFILYYFRGDSVVVKNVKTISDKEIRKKLIKKGRGQNG